jgi:hypothetical protein
MTELPLFVIHRSVLYAWRGIYKAPPLIFFPAVWRFLNSDSVNTVICTKVVNLAYMADGNLQIPTVILQPTLRNYHFHWWK